MSVFRVTIRAEGLRIALQGVEARCGFYKNEYVWARNSEDAIDKARANVQAGLRRNDAANQSDIDCLRLDVDEVEALGILGLLQRQGFVFYPLDGSTHGHRSS
jgi:hypothetical protein